MKYDDETMTREDKFAAAALTGILANPSVDPKDLSSPALLTKLAWTYAQQMVVERRS